MKHYTKNTISATHWCPRCSRNTPHSVHDGRVGGCLGCIERAEQLQRERLARARGQAPEPHQEALKF